MDYQAWCKETDKEIENENTKYQKIRDDSKKMI